MKLLKFSFQRLPIVLGMGLLIGCSQPIPVTHHYLLESPVEFQKAPRQTAKYPISLIIRNITAVSPYDGTDLVVKLRPAEVSFYNYEKWVASPPQMLQQYWLKALAQSGLVEITPARIGKSKDFQLDVEIQEWGQASEASSIQGRLRVFVGLSRTESKAYEWYKVYTVQTPVTTDSAYGVVLALNQGLQELTQKLLADLDHFFAQLS